MYKRFFILWTKT